MNAAAAIELALALLQTVLSNIKGTSVEQNIAQDVQAAVDALLKVHGSDVTFQQLESLRVKATF